jgi:hypothetical protein
MQRRDGTVKDVEDSVEVLGLVDRGDIRGFFDHAHETLIPRGTRAIDARVDIGDVVANGAKAQIRFDVSHRRGQCLGVVIARAENVKGEALRALGPDAGELFQLIDQARHGFGKFGHGEFLNLVIV